MGTLLRSRLLGRRPAVIASCALAVLFSVQRGSAQDSTPFILGPPPGDEPVVVGLGFVLNDINRVDLETQTFEIEGTLTAGWQDERLAFDTLEAGVSEKIFQGDYQFTEVAAGWWPQLVIVNASGPYLRQGQLLRHRWDGGMTYVEELNATVEIPVNLHRFPFERQKFDITFEILGFDRTEVTLQVDSASTGRSERGVRVVGWELTGLEASSGSYSPVYADSYVDEVSTVTIAVDMARRPGFMIRVVILPMMLLVILSWSVFWMDRESLGDRMSISFLGILSVVAYQLTVSSMLPNITYFTLLSAFIYLSFVTMCASVLVNLRVGLLDRAGRTADGDRTDAMCRWAFPLAYVASIALTTGYFFVRY